MVAGLDGNGIRKIYNGPAWGPRWSADGNFVFFSVGPTFAGAGAQVDIYRSRSDGSEAINLTKDSEQNDAFPDVAENGVVFRRGRDGNHEIYWMRPDGTRLRRLTNNQATDTMPAISPNGDMVAFTSTITGDYELYILKLDADGSLRDLQRITDSPGFDMHPKFSPDGDWLVFASQRGGINDEEPLNPIYNPQPYGDIWAVRIQDRAVFRLTHNKWEDGTPSWSFQQITAQAAFCLLIHDKTSLTPRLQALSIFWKMSSRSIFWCLKRLILSVLADTSSAQQHRLHTKISSNCVETRLL
jgi:Tol biopolymer transport system component